MINFAAVLVLLTNTLATAAQLLQYKQKSPRIIKNINFDLKFKFEGQQKISFVMLKAVILVGGDRKGEWSQMQIRFLC